MQKLKVNLELLASSEHYLFSVSDFASLFSEKSSTALLVLLGRAVKSGILDRVCRGFYIYKKVAYPKDLLLYHLAGRLRSFNFCYLSLESVLSENGIISQIPLGCITLMTSGRSGIINCNQYGRIEFTHTKKNYKDIGHFLTYNFRYKLWCASAQLALQDLHDVGRQKSLEYL